MIIVLLAALAILTVQSTVLAGIVIWLYRIDHALVTMAARTQRLQRSADAMDTHIRDANRAHHQAMSRARAGWN